MFYKFLNMNSMKNSVSVVKIMTVCYIFVLEFNVDGCDGLFMILNVKYLNF